MPEPAPAPRARGQHFRFVIRDGVALPDPAEPPPAAPRAPRASRTPGATPAPAAAPEIELESFGGLIRLASEEEVVKVLSAQRELLAMRRATLDSARVQQLRARGEMERARKLERQAKGREAERSRAASAPEAPPPPPRD